MEIYKSDIPSNLLKDVMLFIDYDKRSLFTDDYDDVTMQSIYKRIDLMDIEGLSKRIDDLTNLNSSLDKYLTECNERRYNDLMDVSLYSGFRSKMNVVVTELLPKLSISFRGYMSSTLYNGLDMINSYKRLRELNKLLSLMDVYRRYYGYYDCIRKNFSKPNVGNLIIVSTALFFIRNETSMDLLSTISFTRLKDYFSRQCNRILKAILINSSGKLSISEHVKLFKILGKDYISASNHIINLIDQELISLTSITLQKYVTLDCITTSVYEGCNIIYNQACSLGSNMVLLAICKLLNEYIIFLNSCLSQLDDVTIKSSDYSIVPHDMMDILERFEGLDYNFYCRNVVKAVKCNFKYIKYRMYNILSIILDNVNLTSLKDHNDVIKIIMLLRFFIILNEVDDEVGGDMCFNVIDDNLSSEHGQYLIPSKEDIHNSNPLYTMEGIVNLLIDMSSIYLSGNKTVDLTNSLDVLENAISARLMRYTSIYYVEAYENITIALKNDTLQRQIELQSIVNVYEFNIYSLYDHFKDRIKKGPFIKCVGSSIPLLNPYSGWTPNSNFLGIGIDFNFGTSSKFKMTDDMYPLIKNYGAVYTITSRILLRHFQGFKRIILLQPSVLLNVMKQFTQLLDDFIFLNVTSCGINESVYNNLPNFKSLFPNEFNVGHAERSPLEVHPAVSSSNYLPVNGIATPGDRGYGSDWTSTRSGISETIYGSRGEVNKKATTASGRGEGMNWTSTGLPAADLREAEGDLNRRADGRMDLKWNGEWENAVTSGEHPFKTTSVGTQGIRVDNVSRNVSRMSSISTVGTTSNDNIQSIEYESGKTSLSQLAYTINAIESCFTVLQILYNTSSQYEDEEVKEYIRLYYTSHMDIVDELRHVFYYSSMYNLIQKRSPILKLSHRLNGYISSINDDVQYLLDSFKSHLKNIKEFIEAADCGSISLVVRTYLWKSAMLVIENSFGPLLKIIRSDTSKCNEYNEIIERECLNINELIIGICNGYINSICADHHEKELEIKNMGIYYENVKVLIRKHNNIDTH